MSAFHDLISAYPWRPLGSAANAALLDYLTIAFEREGLAVQSLPFECLHWKPGRSTLEVNGANFDVRSAPFSQPFSGSRALLKFATASELVARWDAINGKILLLHGEIAADPLMPKDFPFYYSDEHKQVIDALERGGAAAVVAVTGKHAMSGLDPFPLTEDGNFDVPSAYSGDRKILAACADGDSARLTIVSTRETAPSRQLVARRAGARDDRIVVCAHMDTKYGTPGALDNAAGVATLLELASRLSELNSEYTVDLVPFNGEECYAVPGQLRYLETLQSEGVNVRLGVNLDGLGLAGAQNGFSMYNLSDEERTRVTSSVAAAGGVLGEEWYAGDHAMFVFRGTPAVAVTSSDLPAALALTHTERDAAHVVDPSLLSAACDALIDIINQTRSPDSEQDRG